jgi:hypothetical protein
MKQRRVATSAGGVCSNGRMDAVHLARRFGLGGAARLSNGLVARGKQGVVWRLETAEGIWAVKVPFRPSAEEEPDPVARTPDL